MPLCQKTCAVCIHPIAVCIIVVGCAIAVVAQNSAVQATGTGTEDVAPDAAPDGDVVAADDAAPE